MEDTSTSEIMDMIEELLAQLEQYSGQRQQEQQQKR